MPIGQPTKEILKGWDQCCSSTLLVQLAANKEGTAPRTSYLDGGKGALIANCLDQRLR
jgi:hypothetical protein